MLNSNLSTRPFYNERAVHLGLALVGIAALGLLVAGGLRMQTLAVENARLAAAAQTQKAQVSAVQNQTGGLRRELLPDDLEALAEATEVANGLIDRRVFSWTEFFNILESTLPDSVMLTSLRPEPEAGAFRLVIGIIGRSQQAILLFVEHLESTGAFASVLVRSEEILEDGGYRAVLDGEYVGVSAEPPIGASDEVETDAEVAGAAQSASPETEPSV